MKYTLFYIFLNIIIFLIYKKVGHLYNKAIGSFHETSYVSATLLETTQ